MDGPTDQVDVAGGSAGQVAARGNVHKCSRHSWKRKRNDIHTKRTKKTNETERTGARKGTRTVVEQRHHWLNDAARSRKATQECGRIQVVCDHHRGRALRRRSCAMARYDFPRQVIW